MANEQDFENQKEKDKQYKKNWMIGNIVLCVFISAISGLAFVNEWTQISILIPLFLGLCFAASLGLSIYTGLVYTRIDDSICHTYEDACFHNAQCKQTFNQILKTDKQGIDDTENFSCKCDSGYKGDRCNISIDNNIYCEDEYGERQYSQFECYIDKYYEGIFSENASYVCIEKDLAEIGMSSSNWLY